MPSFNFVKTHTNGITNGQIHKTESDMIMEAAWNNDIDARVAYFYDYYHDDEPLKYINLHSELSKTKVPIEIKFIVNTYNSENKDQVGYYIQFKPSFRWEEIPELAYYKNVFVDKYQAEFPVGFFIDIPDEKGNYRKWLITEPGDWLGNQFPTWYVLPIDHIFQWIYEGTMYQMCGVSRSQSSYNSGEWTDYKLRTVENQHKCILPMNEISSTIFYNQRIILSAPRKEPVAWHCSKVEQTSPNGSNRLTFAQDLWNEHADAFEYSDGTFSNQYDSNKIVTGMWADYYSSAITPEDSLNPQPTPTIHSIISYSGVKSDVKIRGSYKKFTVDFYNGDNLITPFVAGPNWTFSINGQDASALVNVLTQATSTDLNENQIKLKFIGDDSYIGEILKITHTNGTTTSSIEVELKAL